MGEHVKCETHNYGKLCQANDNKIASWNEVDTLSKLEQLETVYLERYTCESLLPLIFFFLFRNPIYKDDITAYRRKVILALPKITQLDATQCRS